MKIRRISIAISLLLILLLTGVGTGAWLLYSETGSAWLIKHLLAGQGGHVERIEGTLIGHLVLEGLQLERDDLEFSGSKIELDTAIPQLFPPRLQVDLLRASEMTIAPKTTSAPATKGLSMPELPGWLNTLDIEISAIQLDRVRIERSPEPVQLEHLEGELSWKNSQLTLSALQLRTAQLELSGTLTGVLDPPRLEIDLRARNRTQQEGWRELGLKTDIDTADDQLAGPLTLNLITTAGERLTLAGTLALNEQRLAFNRLELRSSQRAGRLVADGRLDFNSTADGLKAWVELDELDLQADLGRPLTLSGTIDVSGKPDIYQGHFTLASRAEGPLAVSLGGAFSGTRTQLNFSDLEGTWLEGGVAGVAKLDWHDGVQLTGDLNGHGLNPTLMHEQLSGELNLELTAELARRAGKTAGQIKVELRESLLHDQPLTGNLVLLLRDNRAESVQLLLEGAGFNLSAVGDPAKELAVNWQVDRLDQLLSGWHGRLNGHGRVSGLPDRPVASFSSHGEQLQSDSLTLESWQLDGSIDADRRWNIAASGSDLNLAQATLQLQSWQCASQGTLESHDISFQLKHERGSLTGRLNGGWNDQAWQGQLSTLSGSDQQFGSWQTPAPTPLLLSASEVSLGQAELASTEHGRVQLQGRYLPAAGTGEGEILWHELDLAAFSPWLGDVTLSGRSNGDLSLTRQGGETLRGHVELAGHLENAAADYNISQATADLDWGSNGLSGTLLLMLDDGSSFALQATTPESFARTLPDQLAIQLRAEGIPLQPLLPELPPGLDVSGRLNIEANGSYSAGNRWQLNGSAAVAAGQLAWKDAEEVIRSDLSTARLQWQWNEELSGTLQLQLAEQGGLEGSFTLPLTATWPLQIPPTAPLEAELHARLADLGLASLLFAEHVQESSGDLKTDIELSGTWSDPQLHGTLKLFSDRAFLPASGILLKDVELNGTFDDKRLVVDGFSLTSGKGTLSGEGEIRLENWSPQGYRLSVSGQDFQLFDLPELQAEVSPQLTVSGDLNSYRVNGTLKLPHFLYSGGQRNELAKASPDLIVVDAPVAAAKPLRLRPELDLQLDLGDQVLLKTAGIDARLTGSLQLKSTTQQPVVAFGEIQVAKGRYASYGVNLDITSGKLYFNGGPLNQPTLDILATRTAGEVKAGVKVSGTPGQPQVTLYSTPALPDTDIVSYIVLGRPLGTGQAEQNSLLLSAAGALLSQGESAVLQEKLKRGLGLDVLDINAGSGDVKSSVITTGKYLNPDLYISFGYSPFIKSNEIKLRYSLSPQWDLESTIGEESGADLYYKIDIP